MTTFPTYEQMAEEVAEKVLDEYLINGKSLREWITIITEQEPCEDCISRTYIEPFIEELENIHINKDKYTLSLLSNIKNAPPIIPQQKIGHWINGYCSECGSDVPAYIIDWRWQKDMDAKYCPMCGAKMENGGII